jgi:hypothetical protein
MSGTLNDEEALKWLENYAYLTKEESIYAIGNIKSSRSLTTSYNYGEDLIQKFITLNNTEDNEDSRWMVFNWLLTNILSPSDLDKKILLPGSR